MLKNYGLKSILYEFSIILEKETDLHRLYFITLPIIIIALDLEKGIIFKYSKRKQCFDPKAGLIKQDIEFIEQKWEQLSEKGEFSDYMLTLDTNKLYETTFNRQIRSLNIPCNDISRAMLNPLITENAKKVDAATIGNKHIAKILEDIHMEQALYFPLISQNFIVGFMLLSPATDNIEELTILSTGLSLTMNILINNKELDNLREILNSNKEDIEHKQKLYEIGKTASTITHEIKNSLIGIIGLFNKLKVYIRNTTKTEKYIQIIESELNRMYRFAVDINKYSGNYISSNKNILDLREIIDKAIDMTSNINNNFIFSVCIDKHASTVFGDKSRLEQVLINLFKNSIEAYNKKDGGKINIRAKRDKGFIILKIRDNAGGVDKNSLKEITKPFYTTKSHGTGLGLSIVKEIIKEHGGNIEFKNTKDGLECTIKLAIPKNITEDENGEEKNFDSR